VTLDDIEWNPAARGVGSLLMLDRGLPRDEFGHPYQPLIWFDDESRTLGLVLDRNGKVLAWGSNADPGAKPADPPVIQLAPEAIARAAWMWLSEHGDPPEPPSSPS
jgi:hypothetical protein